MKKVLMAVILLFAAFGIIWAFNFYWKNLRGIGPALEQPPADISQLINKSGQPANGNSAVNNPVANVPASSSPKAAANATQFPLKLPANFSIEIFANNLPDSRVILFDSQGNLWVSETSQGVIALLTIENGKVTSKKDILKGLRRPHGLAFDPDDPFTLYFAEEDKISRVKVYSEDTPHKIIDLPAGGNHFTRTLGFGPDGRLYVSIGSTCNVCNETDSRRAKIFSLNKDGSDFKEFARGLRNAVFFTWHPSTQKMWATEMGRDLLGDDIPPDEIDIVEQGKNYGWPVCYGQNVHDIDFDHSVYIRNPCELPFEQPAYIDLPAHSAPLGLSFIPEQGWPQDWKNNLIVAFHGSWNRSVPTGYKLVRIKLDKEGKFLGIEDFITGWLTKSGALGRPVDVIVRPGGQIFVSDDKAGVIYKIIYTP